VENYFYLIPIDISCSLIKCLWNLSLEIYLLHLAKYLATYYYLCNIFKKINKNQVNFKKKVKLEKLWSHQSIHR